jgi:hypothetical protein
MGFPNDGYKNIREAAKAAKRWEDVTISRMSDGEAETQKKRVAELKTTQRMDDSSPTTSK